VGDGPKRASLELHRSYGCRAVVVTVMASTLLRGLVGREVQDVDPDLGFFDRYLQELHCRRRCEQSPQEVKFSHHRDTSRTA
jgi:hypothetical protein